jgi:hypothetical protein
MDEKRIVTSAIPNMNVGEVRKHLNYVREQWHLSTSKPFCITERLPDCKDPLTIQQLALAFIKGQHQKRHREK